MESLLVDNEIEGSRDLLGAVLVEGSGEVVDESTGDRVGDEMSACNLCSRALNSVFTSSPNVAIKSLVGCSLLFPLIRLLSKAITSATA
jgi:hypothetical protein